MSYGLQVFSPSGNTLLDSTKGDLLYLDHFWIPGSYNITKSYPGIEGSITFQCISNGWPNLYNNSAYPIMSVSVVDGVPTFTSVASTTSNWPTSDEYLVVIYAQQTPNVTGYGIEILNDLGKLASISEDTKQMRFRGVITTPRYVVNQGGAYQYLYDLQSIGVLGTEAKPPLCFVELRPGGWANLSNLQYIPANGLYDVVVYAQGFVPKIFVFTADTDLVPIIDNSYGLATYDELGNLVFHSGKDFKTMQTFDIDVIPVPTFGGVAHKSFNVAPPANIAAAYYPGNLHTAPGDNLYLTLMTPTATGVDMTWHFAHPAQPPMGVYNHNRIASFIDTDLYL